MSFIDTKTRRDFILNDNLLKVIALLTWPITVQLFINNTMRSVETKLIGMFGAEAITAVSLSYQGIMTLAVPAMGLAMCATALVSNYYGQKKFRESVSVIFHLLSLAIIISFIIIFVGYYFGEDLLKVLGAEDEVFELAYNYLQILLVGAIFMICKFPLWGIFQGLGDTRTPLKLDVINNIVNLMGNFLFILGLGPIPEMGVLGAAAGSVSSSFITLMIGFKYLKAKLIDLDSAKQVIPSINLNILKKIFKLAIPASLHGLAGMITSTLLIMLMTRLQGGTEVVSAYSVSMTIFGFTTLPAASVATVSASIVGINLGNGNKTRALKGGIACAYSSAVIISVLAVLIYFFSPNFLEIFVKELDVITEGTVYLQILAISMPIHALGVVFSRAIHGAGNAKSPLLISLITGLGLRIPFAYILAFTLNLESYGIWISIAVTQIISAVWIMKLFFRTINNY